MESIAAVTMVYRSYTMLKRWYEHYGRLVGFENCYVVSHGADPKHREIAPDANHIGIPRTGLERFDNVRHNALNGLTRFLEAYHDAVLRTDVDEFVFVDPREHDSLADCLTSVAADVWFAVGFNVLERPDDPPLKDEAPISETRSFCVFSPSYSKAVAVRNGIFMGFHGARDPVHDDARRMGLPKGLYLAHARFAEEASIVGTGDYEGATIFNRTKERTARDLQEMLDLPEVDGETELTASYDYLVDGFGTFRKRRPKLYVAARRPVEASFRLPERFVGMF